MWPTPARTSTFANTVPNAPQPTRSARAPPSRACPASTSAAPPVRVRRGVGMRTRTLIVPLLANRGGSSARRSASAALWGLLAGDDVALDRVDPHTLSQRPVHGPLDLRRLA